MNVKTVILKWQTCCFDLSQFIEGVIQALMEWEAVLKEI